MTAADIKAQLEALLDYSDSDYVRTGIRDLTDEALEANCWTQAVVDRVKAAMRHADTLAAKGW